MAISIQPVTHIEDCQAIEQLQATIWGGTERLVTPGELLLIIAKEGGIVLLARDESGRPVGFSFGLLGQTVDGRLKLASHQTGVLPAYQNTGLGYQIKLVQRQAALTAGLKLITWTFDPLQGRNAYLNLSKLGAVCSVYLRHLYGDMDDDLNRGLPSDRFRADWWIASTHVAHRLTASSSSIPSLQASAPLLNHTTTRLGGLLAPPDVFNLVDAPFCRVEIPPDFPALKAADSGLALAWRLHTRQVFEACLAAGYIATNLLRSERRNYYLWQKNWQPE
jgi:predicted GNAT superfamily acetyltransferase